LWDKILGSAGRGAIALASLDSSVKLHAYLNEEAEAAIKEIAAWDPGLSIERTPIDRLIGFDYLHTLARPTILNTDGEHEAPIHVSAERVLRYGMLEGEALVDAEWAVYDPQNGLNSRPFNSNGSKAEHLAVVLNEAEAGALVGTRELSSNELAPLVAELEGADAVVLKMGPRGALVWTPERASEVPAYKTKSVWKLGSGDCFAAYFAKYWMLDGRSAEDSARSASLATAYYCETQGFSNREIEETEFSPIIPTTRSGKPLKVYLAGPFFELSQIWLVEEVRLALQGMGLSVFSPYHDVGLGSAEDVVDRDIEAIVECDIVFANANGSDPGTIFEIGYARSLGKPVVVYCEDQHEEKLKMVQGTGCLICRDLTTGIYQTVWEAMEL